MVFLRTRHREWPKLARGRSRPEGDGHAAYVPVASLDAASRIDLETWKDHRKASRLSGSGAANRSRQGI